MITGYAAGAFDLFHVGHLNILRQAKSRCDYLIAGVVSDERLLQTKGKRPVIPESERLDIVSSIGFVDEAVLDFHPNRLLTWEDVRFDVFFKGDDWKGTHEGKGLEELFATVGVRVEYFPYTVHTSSTKLRVALEQLSSPSMQVQRA